MTGVITIVASGRVWFQERYSFIDDRRRILSRISEEFEPPYEIIIMPDVSEEIEVLHWSKLQVQFSLSPLSALRSGASSNVNIKKAI
ncbi:hypothetical protein [Chitinophaga rhizosphaerae]|uniref:hypothetical protein n=1 Tax=Chitinophaga rhizosphaerae TaxID=1864947 RepID=UPI0013DFA46E|nr:hypothetical protein [Chitinophaga rhizosphaerae]